MIAGKLNEMITVQEPITCENDLGEIMDNMYQKKFSTRAQVIFKNGNLGVDNDEIFTSYSIQFIVRIYHKIEETDRIIYRNKAYKINSIEISKEYQLMKINTSLINE